MTHGEIPAHAPSPINPSTDSTRHRRQFMAAALLAGGLAIATIAMAAPANAAAYENAVGLGSASAYSVLAGTTVTNTGPSVLSGSLGVNPGNAITGFPPGLAHGTTNAGTAAAGTAQSSLTASYLDAAGRAPTGSSLGLALAGGSLLPGVYNASSALDISGNISLNGQGNPNSVFIFQIGSALTSASGTNILLTGAAQACNVFWQVSTSATLGTNNIFVGTVMALTSITVTTGTTVRGRALARNGAVTLDNNVFTSAACAATPTKTTVADTNGTTSSTLSATVTATGASPPAGGTVTFLANGVSVGTGVISSTGTATLTLPTASLTGKTLTARFNGRVSYTPSTSTSLRVLAPGVPSTTITPLTPGTSLFPPLASTGANDTVQLIGGGTAAVAIGVLMLIAVRPRAVPQAAHRAR